MNQKTYAAVIDEVGPPEMLTVREVPMPQLGPDSVLVRVISAGVQPTDAAIRSGWVPPGATITFPQVLGNEFSGVVAGTGTEVTDLGMGEAVLLGCYAEYVAVPRAQVARAPQGIGWKAAGALSASGQTALTALEALSVTPERLREVAPRIDVADAHRDVETGHGRGKVVLEIGYGP